MTSARPNRCATESSQRLVECGPRPDFVHSVRGMHAKEGGIKLNQRRSLYGFERPYGDIAGSSAKIVKNADPGNRGLADLLRAEKFVHRVRTCAREFRARLFCASLPVDPLE